MNAAVIEPREGVQDLEPIYTGFEFMNNGGNYSCPPPQNLPAKPDSVPAANMMSGGFNTSFASGTRVMNPLRYPVGMSTADSRLQRFDQEWVSEIPALSTITLTSYQDMGMLTCLL